MGTVFVPSSTRCLISGVANGDICFLDRKRLEPKELLWQHHWGCHFVSFVMHIYGAKFPTWIRMQSYLANSGCEVVTARNHWWIIVQIKHCDSKNCCCVSRWVSMIVCHDLLQNKEYNKKKKFSVQSLGQLKMKNVFKDYWVRDKGLRYANIFEQSIFNSFPCDTIKER